MKCLVTGSSGFIGTHLVRALEKRGHEIMRAGHFDLDIAMPKAIEYKIGLRFSPDYIFHLAAYGNMATQTDHQEIFNANLSITYKLLEGLKDIPYKAFINVSTSAIQLPHQTLYSATKSGAEALCNAYRDEYKKPIITLRPFSVYGAGEADFRFIPTVFRSCLKGELMNLDAQASHDWIYVSDFVEEMIKTAENPEKYDRVRNIGTGIGRPNVAVVGMIERLTGKHANANFVNSLRSFDILDWECPERHPEYIQLKEGLKKYYESIK